jgi:hypothetical protein
MSEEEQQNEQRSELMKAAVKEGIKEWLDEKFTQLGKWSLTSIALLGLAALLYFILWSNGWKAPH